VAFASAENYLERKSVDPDLSKSVQLRNSSDRADSLSGDRLADHSHCQPGATATDRSRPSDCSSDIESTRSACRSLAVFGIWAGWGLAVVGLLEGLVGAVAAILAAEIVPARRAGLLMHSIAFSIGWLLAGWGTWVLSRVASSAIVESLQRLSRASDETAIQLAKAVALLESLTRALRERVESVSTSDSSLGGRAHALEKIERATRTAQWSQAEALITEFEADFPGDPRPAELRVSLASAQRGAIEQGLAQLEAARSANDADRVLELYPIVASSMGDEARGSLSSDLSAWFLSLIHRRLRAGKIQADVVQLAGRFAETFSTTVEGASVRASLATLRRSVGLCPRCAQPYVGIAEACPTCLGKTTAPPAGGTPNAALSCTP
jgi:hypothetical protein